VVIPDQKSIRDKLNSMNQIVQPDIEDKNMVYLSMAVVDWQNCQQEDEAEISYQDGSGFWKFEVHWK